MKKITPTEFYDKLFLTYDDICENPDYNIQHLNEAKKLFHKYAHQNGSILDVGCGTGLLSKVLEGDFQYTGIDVSANMLEFANQRGYQTIHKPIEQALPEIKSQSYDFVVSLGSLLFVEDIQSSLKDIYRIARKAIVLSLDDINDDFLRDFTVKVYNHARISIPEAKEDYSLLGWKSPTVGVQTYTRMIYIEKLDPS